MTNLDSTMRSVVEELYVLGFDHGSSDNQTLKRAVGIDLDLALSKLKQVIKDVMPGEMKYSYDPEGDSSFDYGEVKGYNQYRTELLTRLEGEK